MMMGTAMSTYLHAAGAPLVLTGPKSIAIKSNPIKMEIPDGGVTSEFANKATDNQWNAYRGMSDDKFPEVPPDGESDLLNAYRCLMLAAGCHLLV